MKIPQILTPILPDHEFYLEIKFRTIFFCYFFVEQFDARCKSTQGSLTLRWRNYKRSFTLKTHQIYPVHTTPEELKTQLPVVILDLCLRKIRVRKITRPSRHHRFRNVPFSKYFPCHGNQNAGVFKFLPLWRPFRKAPFSWRICVHGKPNRRNKATF